MSRLADVLRYGTVGVFALLAVVCVVQWRRRGGPGAGWVAASFGVLAAVALEGLILPDEPEGLLAWVRTAGVATVLLFPYLLYRFATAVERPSRALDVAAHALTIVVVVWALLVPATSPGEPRSAVVWAFVVAVMAQWSFLSAIVAVRLWRAGRDEPTPGRRRLRLLSVASIALNAALVLAGSIQTGESEAGAVAAQLSALVSGALFFLAFSPPRPLRLAWRGYEEQEFRHAIRELMSATRTEDVTARLLPHVTRIVAARWAVVLDEAGTVIGASGEVPAAIGRGAFDGSPGGEQLALRDPNVLRLPLRSGSLLVRASAYTPVFGREDVELLEGLGTLADLAMERVEAGERAARLAAIVQSSHDAILSKDLNGTITSWNRGAEEIYGYTRAEAVGRSIFMLAPPEHTDEVRGILERIRRGERIDHYETRRRRKDGRHIAVSLSISPIRGPDGSVIGAATIARDVTAQKQAEQTIRDQAELLDLAQDAIIARDLDGRINYWNRGAAEWYGFSREEALGKVGHELLGTKFPSPPDEIHARLLREGRWEGELVQTRQDGSEIIVSSRWVVRLDHRGRPAQVLEVNTDVTQQRAAARALQTAKEEAERASLAKSEFLSRMSHELRTPLNAILGFGQLLEMEDLTEEQRDSVREIVKGGTHLLDLINEVLDITRIEAGKLAISLEPVAAQPVVAEALSLIRPLAEQRAMALRYQAAGCADEHVLADNQRLKQVLLNLLSNAVKYNVDGGSVHVRCGRTPGDRLRISVSDTGRGIRTERLEQIFEPFERLGAERTSTEGSGLGLALAKRLMEAMGGTIGVDTEPGKGSTFWIELPVAEHPVALAELSEGSREETPARPRRSRTALYIEDNLSNLKLVQRLLERRPEVSLIASMQGRVGLDLARQHRPDLILLDLQLPDVTGREVLEALKGDEATRDIPVVVVSADATRGQVRELLAAGAIAYLTKPLDVQRFLRILDEQVGDEPAELAGAASNRPAE